MKINELPQEVMIMILANLQGKDDIVGKLGRLNTQFKSIYGTGENQVMWHKLYKMRFRNPGFKFDKVKWKQAFLKKENQSCKIAFLQGVCGHSRQVHLLFVKTGRPV